MPTIVWVEGYQIILHTRNEHQPAHVHVRKAGADVRVRLNDRTIGPTLWDVKGSLSDRQIVRAVELVWEHHGDCLEMWRRYHGHLE